MEQLKILVIVEDEEDMRRMIQALLTRDPRLVVSGHATTAAEAIEAAASLAPGLIVLDHFIDGPVTGLDAAPALKRVAPSAKVLLFSAHDLRSEARQSPDIDAYLQKDQPQKLLPLAQSLLGLGPIAA